MRWGGAGHDRGLEPVHRSRDPARHDVRGVPAPAGEHAFRVALASAAAPSDPQARRALTLRFGAGGGNAELRAETIVLPLQLANALFRLHELGGQLAQRVPESLRPDVPAREPAAGRDVPKRIHARRPYVGSEGLGILRFGRGHLAPDNLSVAA